jgi:hypothetical protein
MTTLDRNGLLEQINRLLAEEVGANPVTYNKERSYQSYERIGFVGRRWSVERRLAEYGLDQLVRAESSVLDIGCHCGFFTVEFALSCRLAHGIEPNPILNTIAMITAEYLGVANRVRFFDCTFEEFETDLRYDLVLSLAAFYTQDGRERSPADHYFSKINRLLSKQGQLFFESTSYTKDPAMPHYRASGDAIEAISRHLNILNKWETPSGSPGWFRQFAIATKRDNA